MVTGESPAPVRTLRAAQEQVNREWPGRSASVSEWQSYYERAANMYERVAEIDNGHHYEALYWAGQARESLRALTERAGADHGA